MLSLRIIAAAILGSSLMTAGCIAEPLDGEGDGAEDVAETEQEFRIMNGTNPNFFWLTATQATLQTLAAAPLLDPVTGEIVMNPLFDTADGRELLKHIIGCSFKQGTTAMRLAQNFSAKGYLGLGTMWKTGPLDSLSQQRWVTACLLQTLNGVGAHVEVNATGYAIEPDPGDTSDYVFNDMIAFGNIFGVNKKAYACPLKQFAVACGFNTSIYAAERVCGTSPTCGLTLLPACDSGVCETDGDGNSKCNDGNGNSYEEAIMTTLEKTGFQQMYEECRL